MDNHPTGRHSPRAADTNKIREGGSDTRKSASSQKEHESEDCSSPSYGKLRIEAGHNLSPPRLIDSDDESESDTEDDAIIAIVLNRGTNPTPATEYHASGKVKLEHETKPVPLKNMNVVRKRYVQD